jgi:hypothetical protein
MSSIGFYRFHKSVGRTPTAGAVSSDTVESPALPLDGFGARAAATICVEPLLASPARVRVRSDVGGAARIQVATDHPGAAPAALRALNDTFAFDEDAGADSLDVLANHTNAAGGTVAVIAAARLGTAVAQADGTTSSCACPSTVDITHQ